MQKMKVSHHFLLKMIQKRFFFFAVQRRVNDIQLIQGWLDSGPSLFYVFFAGAISDHLGRKPLLFVPLIGVLVIFQTDIKKFVSRSFHAIPRQQTYRTQSTGPSLMFYPLSFSTLKTPCHFLGGILCIIWASTGSDLASQRIQMTGVVQKIVLLIFPQMQCTVMLYGNFRAHVLARYDGMESFATIIGTALSPVVFNAVDYYGCYAIRWKNILASKIRIYPFFAKKLQWKVLQV